VSLAASELDSSLPEKDNPPDCPAQVSFLELRDGDTVPQTFRVQFVVTGMDIAPAGVNKQNTGHHHILIDLRKPTRSSTSVVVKPVRNSHSSPGNTPCS
jgi:hypothetical protein